MKQNNCIVRIYESLKKQIIAKVKKQTIAKQLVSVKVLN